MKVTKGRTGNLLEVSNLDSRAIVNLNRDGITRTDDAILYGFEIEEILQTKPKDIKMPEFCKKVLGISHIQTAKYRRAARGFASNDPVIKEVFNNHYGRGIEFLDKGLSGVVSLRGPIVLD